MSRLHTRTRHNRFTPRLELLDDRVVPSCTVVQDGGLLRIEGDNKSNAISIVDDGTTVTVTCDGGSAKEYTDVTEIEVRGGNGQDVVTYDLTIADPGTGEAGTAVNRTVDVKLGNGIDSFTGSVDGDLAESSAVDVSVKGCNGKDTLGFDVVGSVAADVNLNVNLQGGNGMDVVLSSYAGQLLGILTWDVTGGNGKDELTANMTFDVDSNGTADVEVHGCRAPDTMTLLVEDNSGDDDDPLTIDDPSELSESSFKVFGGHNHDTATVSDEVVVASA
jgi:hypothetical protein